MSAAAGSSSSDLIRSLYQALYDVVNGITSVFGLNPYQVLELAGALVVLVVVVAFIRTATGRRGWSLD
jgi:hypothetical protein